MNHADSNSEADSETDENMPTLISSSDEDLTDSNSEADSDILVIRILAIAHKLLETFLIQQT